MYFNIKDTEKQKTFISKNELEKNFFYLKLNIQKIKKKK